VLLSADVALIHKVRIGECNTEGETTTAGVRTTGIGVTRSEITDVQIGDGTDAKGVMIQNVTGALLLDQIEVGSSTGVGVDIASCTGTIMVGVVSAPSSSTDVSASGSTSAAAIRRFGQLALEAITIPAADLTINTGSPVLSTGGGGLPGWLMDASATEAVAAIVGRDRIPAHWKTLAVDAVWANATTNAGDVRFDASHGWMADGDAFSTGTYVNGTAAAAPTVAGEQKTTRVVASSTVTKDRMYVRVIRNGGHVSDTLANDCILVGVRLVRLT
jgi:hypothetical protein